MITATFPRITIPTLIENEKLIALGKKIRSVLSYHELNDRIYNHSLDVKFLSTLEKLNCLPFKEKPVRSYMFKEKFKKNAVMLIPHYIISVITIIISFATISSSGTETLPIVVLCVIVAFTFMVIISNIHPLYKWDNFPLSNGHTNSYKNPLPLEVLDKAVKIKEKHKEAIFRVHELNNIRKVADPFLSVRVNEHGKEYFIAVWDEPTFKIKEKG